MADPTQVSQAPISHLTKIIHNFFDAQATKISKQIVRNADKYASKADEPTKGDIDDMMDGVDLDWTFLVNPTKKQLAAVGTPAAKDALAALGVTDDDLFSHASQKVLDFASERAAQMVGMKWVNGELVENPNAQWAITDATRDFLRTTITDALKDGLSGSSLKARIEASGAFDSDRAKMIAQNELTHAYMQANKIGWEASGLDLEKRSLLSDDHDEPDECDDNADAGWIDYDDDYPSGDDSPEFHVRCHCAQIVRTKEAVDIAQPEAGDEGDKE